MRNISQAGVRVSFNALALKLNGGVFLFPPCVIGSPIS